MPRPRGPQGDFGERVSALQLPHLPPQAHQRSLKTLSARSSSSYNSRDSFARDRASPDRKDSFTYQGLAAHASFVTAGLTPVQVPLARKPASASLSASATVGTPENGVQDDFECRAVSTDSEESADPAKQPARYPEGHIEHQRGDDANARRQDDGWHRTYSSYGPSVRPECEHRSLSGDKVATDVLKQLHCPSGRPDRGPSGPVHVVKTVVKYVLACALLVSLIVGYAEGVSVINLQVATVGTYGLILMVDFLVQYLCAILNRIDVTRIVEKAKAKRKQTMLEKPQTSTPQSIARVKQEVNEKLSDRKAEGQAIGMSSEQSDGLMNPPSKISIAVVGYREEERAWTECIESLQKQSLPPKCIVGVIDGNESQDLDMAHSFMKQCSEYRSRLIHLPKLLSAVHRESYFTKLNSMEDRRNFCKRWYDRVRGHRTQREDIALQFALDVVMKQVMAWEEEFELSSYEALCFTQPHGHKRTAMFTAFAIALYAVKTEHAVFTTDSDTLVKSDALDEMYTLLDSDPTLGGVTADVKIYNRAQSILARLCAVRYWFAFNIERACQSWWGCVGCLSGPMSMYRSCDLHQILGLWNLQTFAGKETTFGDDRHLSNQLLAQGLRTRFSHRTWCESESPVTFVRWVKQQTRWSKSFYREVFWFPHSFALQSWWLLVESSKQALYPFILIATVFHLLFGSTENTWRPVAWLVAMFGIAFIKSCLAVMMSRDPWLFLFSGYGFFYFFGLLPSKIWAMMTMNKTTWGTSARSLSEMSRATASFRMEMFHVGHLVFWYMAIATALAYYLSNHVGTFVYMPLTAIGLVASFALFFPLSAVSGTIQRLWTRAGST